MEVLTDDQMHAIGQRLREIDEAVEDLMDEAVILIKKRAEELHRRSSQNADCPSAKAEPEDAQPVNAESEGRRTTHKSKSPLTVAKYKSKPVNRHKKHKSKEAQKQKRREIRADGSVAARRHLRKRRRTAKAQATKHIEDSDSCSNCTEEFNRNVASLSFDVLVADGEEHSQRTSLTYNRKRRGDRRHGDRKRRIESRVQTPRRQTSP